MYIHAIKMVKYVFLLGYNERDNKIPDLHIFLNI